MYEQLLEKNRGLLVYAARKYATACQYDRAVEMDDLVQAGFIGLVNASQTYEKDKGSWSSWALRYIYNEIDNALGRRNGRWIKAHTGAASLDMPLTEGSDETWMDMLADDALPPIEDVVEQAETRRTVCEAVATLKDDQQREVVQRYKLGGETARQVGEAMGVSPVRVQTIWNAARQQLAKNRRLRDMADLTPYYRHIGVNTFNTTWTSVTELAAMWRIQHKGE